MRFVRSRGDPPESVEVEALREAVAVEGVELAVLFGSYALDDAGRLSDLDVAVLFDSTVDGPRKRRRLDELTVAIQRATGVEAVDLVDLDATGPELGYEALSTGVLVLGDRERATDLEAELLQKALDLQPVKQAWRAALDERLREGSFGRP